LAQNSWVCFTSDHGELLGDHHLYGKRLPYEGSARVPLILKGPKGCDVPRGEVRDPVIEQRDIMPTLLECAGLKIPKTVEGRSFLDVARGKAKEIRPYLHGEHHVWAANNKYKAYSIQWLTDGRQKYIWLSGDGHEQLFDLVNDPNELHNLAAKPKMRPALETWRRRLVGELDGREEGFVKNKQLVTGRPTADALSWCK
jgi:arylsulfatase A-like enzyme